MTSQSCLATASRTPEVLGTRASDNRAHSSLPCASGGSNSHTCRIIMRLNSKKRQDICDTCRARKVRCDSSRPTCGNCERLGFACTTTGQFEQVGRVSNHERRRARQACTNCHNLKARCSGQKPQCTRCLDRGLNCVYEGDKSPKSRSNTTTTTVSHESPAASSLAGGSTLSPNLSTTAHDL